MFEENNGIKIFLDLERNRLFVPNQMRFRSTLRLLHTIGSKSIDKYKKMIYNMCRKSWCKVIPKTKINLPVVEGFNAKHKTGLCEYLLRLQRELRAAACGVPVFAVVQCR